MKRLIIMFVFFAGIISVASAQLPETVNWAPSIKMDKHIFPSYIIASAAKNFQDQGDHYFGEPKGLIGIQISSTYRFAKFKLVIKADEIADATEYEFTLPHDKRREMFLVFPNINYRYQQLKKINQPVPVNVTFILYIDGKEEKQKIETISVHSINDCPFHVINPDKSPVDMKWMFAAYVNENHPMIDQVLREALNTGLVDQFTDYQLSSSTNKDELFRQVIAIWAALYNRRITYSNTVTPSLWPGNNIASQHVRFFDEALNSAQANCMDGSVVFASIFRKIGIDPVLVIIPQHAYMGFYTGHDKNELYCLETTLIGKKNITAELVDSLTLGYYLKLFPKDIADKNRNAIISFAYAQQTGTKNYKRNAEDLNGSNNNYLFIDISKSRKTDGVIPIPD
jgi:hypothetical protein